MSVSFHPPIRTLMGPGPSDVSPRVLAAMARPTIGHLDPLFIHLMDDIKRLLQMAFQTRNELTLPISAPGSSGMEACFVNLLEAGDKVIVCQNGVFGGRMKENVERCGATAIMVQDSWGCAVDPQKLDDALKRNPDTKVVAFVHAETSTGAQSDAQTLCSLAQQYDCLSIVDTVTSLGGTEVDVDGWGADAVYSGTQKCLSCVPGLAPVTFSERAVKTIKNRNTKVQSWFLDMELVMGYWGGSNKRAYHHTAPINTLYALHESLLMLEEEGLHNAWQRHQLHHQALAQGISELGVRYIVDEQHRLPQLNSVTIPNGIDDAAVRKMLLDRYNLEIGAGLGDLADKVWRIGLMGFASNRSNVILCLNALDNVLREQGSKHQGGLAVAAANRVYDAN